MGALRDCELAPLLMLTQKLLTLSNYGEVLSLDRWVPRQKSRFGGCELLCTAWFGEHRATVLVKVVRDWAKVRMVSELAGTVERLGADSGILVATRPMGPKVRAEVARFARTRIEVFDAERLTDLMTRHRVGVRPDGSVDYAYWGQLHELGPKLVNSIQFLRR
ncbi:MAG: restriction endonuclease [Armatimonadetes bacterium]|nr:restriction endonuclease [Armatimonadota bacterium]